MLRKLPLILALSLLTGCGFWTRSRTEPTVVILPELPAEIRACEKLKPIAGRIGEVKQVGEATLVTLWAEDRTVAVKCSRKHDATVTFYEDLRTRLSHPEK